MIPALILGRSESYPFPGRNTFPLLGRPLMVYPLLAASNAREVQKAFLSTDNEEMTRIGEFYGAQPIVRPNELRRADVNLEKVIAHGYQWIRKKEASLPELLVVLLANAPTVTSGLIDQGIEMMRKNPSLDAVITVTQRNAFSPNYALHLLDNGLVKPFMGFSEKKSTDIYFPNALLWIIRPTSFFRKKRAPIYPNQIVNPARQRVAALVHEGYEDVDYPWQIPAVEEWLKRRGFSDEKTPYDKHKRQKNILLGDSWKASIFKVAPEKRILITTSPFGNLDDRPMKMLEDVDCQYVVNPLGRRLREDELKAMIGDFGILIAGTEPITADVLSGAPHLKLIARVGIGLDNVDLKAAKKKGIQVTYTPDAPAPAVAELTLGLMLATLRHVATSDRQLKSGVWHRIAGRRLSETKVGIFGVGRIGKRVIQHLKGAFPGVTILANDLSPDLDFGRTHGVLWATKEEIYPQVDVLSIHLPLTKQTRHLIGVKQLSRMAPTSILINTARGGIVNERDLAQALSKNRLAGAALDVFEREPYAGGLTSLNNCLLTSHIGSLTQDCRVRMEVEATNEATRFIRGEPLKCLVPQHEYEIQN